MVTVGHQASGRSGIACDLDDQASDAAEWRNNSPAKRVRENRTCQRVESVATMRRKATLSLQEWGLTLPSVAAKVVAEADLTQPHVYLRFTADPGKLGVARHEMLRWADELDLSGDLVQDIVLAIDEATTNAVEHAYVNRTGPVTVFAAGDRSRHHAWTVVSDCGRWRPPRTESRGEKVSLRGRGLLLMAALADEFDVTSTVGGTTVVLGWPIADLRPMGGDDTLQIVKKVS